MIDERMKKRFLKKMERFEDFLEFLISSTIFILGPTVEAEPKNPIMGICSSSPSGSESSYLGQSEAFRKILMSSVQKEKSVPPALNLEERPYALSRGTENALARAMKDIETERPSLSVRNRVYQYQHRTVTAGDFAMVFRTHWLAHQGYRTLEIIARLKTWQESKSTFGVSLISQIDFLRLSGRLENLDRGILHYILNYAQRYVCLLFSLNIFLTQTNNKQTIGTDGEFLRAAISPRSTPQLRTWVNLQRNSGNEINCM